MNWVDGEIGTKCDCGRDMKVLVDMYGIGLACIYHKDASLVFPLPKNRPNNWPKLTEAEVQALCIKGQEEADSENGVVSSNKEAN